MCQVPNSPILEKLNAALQKSWQSLGSVTCKINEEPDCLEVMFFPAVRELHGGKHDGEICMRASILMLAGLLGFLTKILCLNYYLIV